MFGVGTSCRETFEKGNFAWMRKRDEECRVSVGSSKARYYLYEIEH